MRDKRRLSMNEKCGGGGVKVKERRKKKPRE